MLLCGTYEMNITPPLGTPIPGGFREKRSSGIKDDLYAKALVIADKETVVALLCIDVLGVQQTIVKKIRQRIYGMAGIREECIMISATHTHTGGPRIPREYESADTETENYLEHMVKKAADAVIIAFQKRQEAQIGFGIGKEESIAFNRRFWMKSGEVKTNPGVNNPDIVRAEGPIDPDVLVVRVDDLQGNPLAVLLNYACHTCVVGGSEYSADYPGEISRIIKRVLGEKVVCLFGLGACADINHIDVHHCTHVTQNEHGQKKPGEHYKKMGRMLAGEVLGVREKITYTSSPSVAARRRTLSMARRLPTSEELEEAKTLVEAQQGKNGMDVGTAGRMLRMRHNEQVDKTAQVEVQVIKIGALAVVGIPCELFVEYGLEIKNKSIATYNMINTLANGSHGYVPTKAALSRGGYETLPTSNRLEAHAGERMVSAALDLLRELDEET